MSTVAQSLKRQQKDVMKLMSSAYEVEISETNAAKGTLDFLVHNFKGPSDSTCACALQHVCVCVYVCL
ncbi:hypothetical protein EON66_03195 [archaeon]|nr:MAG: hypothetical protein EON66_03195 [archaeon]